MPRHNNFDLLRLVFAFVVVLFHCHDLSLSPAYSWIPFVASSRFAVEGFFTMSGCLIVGSFDRNPNLLEYLEKRARRILPAYWASLLFTLVIAVFLSDLPVGAFVLSASTWKYIAANLVFANFLHPALPGLFTRNPVMPAVNGALWTIKVEIMFYLMAPLIVLGCRRLGSWRALGAICLASLAYRAWCVHANHPSLAVQLPGQLCYFAIGSAVYYYYPWFERHRRWMWVVAIASYAMSLVAGWLAFRVVGVALGVMCVGLLLPCLRGPAKYGDFSYGTYVLHFPIIQMFISFGLVDAYPNAALCLIVVIVGLLAIGSWKFVEEPCLRGSRVKAMSAVPGGC